MFDINDLYSVSGGVSLFNYWNPFVTKHDTSSFYNWEQDNLPLYDLEERTHYLWEKFGYPLSGVPGMAMVVSSTIPDVAASANVFTSLSAAIEALPEIIRMPTLIEIASSGSLGELELKNIKVVDDGVLEIVNRVFAPISNNTYSMYMQTGGQDSGWQYLPEDVSGVANGFMGTLSSTSAVSLSANTSSLLGIGSTNESRNFIIPGRGHNTGVTTAYNYPGAMYVGANAGTSWSDFPAGELFANSISPTGATPTNKGVVDPTASANDVQVVRMSNQNLVELDSYVDNQLARGIYTNNRLSNVKVSNCDGPIYLRGFIVDGENSQTKGFDINNANDLTLENCGSMRCTESGFSINNSNINLRRQSFAGRNYNATDDTTRNSSKTYGYKIVNSDVNFVTDSYNSGRNSAFASFFHDYGIYLDNSKLRGGDIITTTAQTDVFYTDIGYNRVGLYLNNSKYEMDGVLNVYNSNINIDAQNSEIEVEQLRCTISNKIGLMMDSSKFSYNKNLRTQSLGANTAAKTVDSAIGSPGSHNYPILFWENGQHLSVLNGSRYGTTYPKTASGVDLTQLYNQEIYYKNHGEILEESSTRITLPQVVVSNSFAEFTCAKFINSRNSSTDMGATRHLLVTNGATAVVRGLTNTTSNTSCWFNGAKYTTESAITAEDKSNVFITGPVAIANHGTGIAAHNNSKIQISEPLNYSNSYLGALSPVTPPALPVGYDFTVSGWANGLYKSTPVVEIHSQGDCLVAETNSEIVLKNIGDATSLWGTDQNTDIDLEQLQALKSCVSGGALQFYPNEATDSVVMGQTLPTDGGDASANFNSCGIKREGMADTSWTNPLTYDLQVSAYRLVYSRAYSDNQTETDFLAITNGGNCVRASKGSTVKVQNVHFPMGHVPGDQSYYDISASPQGCEHLMIWNIQDTSKLYADYCSVSGTYPLSAGYAGPRSHYHTGTLNNGNDASTVVYGVPSGTPDTGMLSVLDHYGSGVTLSSDTGFGLSAFMSAIGEARTGVTTSGTYGELGFQNRGPFRLFFSVSPAAKKLMYYNGGSPDGEDNLPYQHLSQGYLLSGDCSALPSFSGTHPELLNRELYDQSGILTTSGYYWPSAMLPPERSTVWLDKSCANLFANAKHCNTDYSNRIKLVNIHDNLTTAQGESHSGATTGLGQGFRTSNIYDKERRT